MAKGCPFYSNSALHFVYCRRFCEETLICPGETEPGCTVCIGYNISVVTNRLGECVDDPPFYSIKHCKVIPSVVIRQEEGLPITFIRDTCWLCPLIWGHPCFSEYLEYVADLELRGVYHGPLLHCECPE